MTFIGKVMPGTGLPRRNQFADGSLDPPAVDQNLRYIMSRLDELGPLRGDKEPEVELLLGQEYVAGALVGTMTVTVRDVGKNFQNFVRFAIVEGDAEFTHDDPTDLSVWNLSDAVLPYYAEVDLAAKHGGLIAVAVPYRSFTDPSITQWVIRQHRYDEDFDAELTGHELAFDTSGYPLLSLTGDEDDAKNYVTMTVGDDQASATPSDPTASVKDATLVGRTGKLRFDGTGGVANKQAAMGKIVGYKVACENGDGIVNTTIFGPYFQRRGDSKTQAPRIQVTAIRSGSTVTVSLIIDDPTKAVTAVAFRKQDGGGSLDAAFGTGWTSTGFTPGSSTSGTDTIDVTSAPGLAAKLIWRVTWTDESGTSQYKGDELDLSHLEAVTKVVRVSHSQLVPGANGLAWTTAPTHVQPGTAGVSTTLVGWVPLPKGVSVSLVAARMYKAAAGDLVECYFYRTDDSGTASLRKLLTLGTAAAWHTESDTVTESASDTANNDYLLYVVMTGAGLGDAKFRYFEFTYSAPSYDKTY